MSRSATYSRTAIEKIVAAHALHWSDDAPPRVGDYVTIRPRHVMTHDNSSAVIDKFRATTGPDGTVFDPTQPVLVMDHDIQNHSPENLAKYAKIRAFAERHGLRYEPPGRGIAHQVMIEEGFVTPGSLIVGSDSHSNIYGALAAVGTPVVRTDASRLWATGNTWWVIPPQVRVTLTGSLQPGVCGKDVILALCSLFPSGEVLNAAIEFAGSGVASLSVEDRLSIANMTTEWGALVGYFPHDEVLDDYLAQHGIRSDSRAPVSDPEAHFVLEIELDLSTVAPRVTGPNTIGSSTNANETGPIPINKAYLMSCVNARLADFEAAAACFAGGRRVAAGVEFFIAAASSRIEHAARESGSWQTLIDAGAIPLPPGCGACIGLGAGTLKPGETGISATNRNFEGRMGARDAQCYLASPAVVAESAIRGHIASPSKLGGTPVGRIVSRGTRQDNTSGPTRIIDGFPNRLDGRALLLTQPDINTDGIYGKEVTYRDDITLANQGQHAMLNYDPAFQSIALRGDILVAGERFGVGSSREQAATALMSRGISMLIASSVSETYLRNAINNGLIVITCPEFVSALMSQLPDCDSPPRTIAGPDLRVDFESSTVIANCVPYRFHPLGEAAQRMILEARSSSELQSLNSIQQEQPA